MPTHAKKYCQEQSFYPEASEPKVFSTLFFLVFRRSNNVINLVREFLFYLIVSLTAFCSFITQSSYIYLFIYLLSLFFFLCVALN